LSKSDERGVEKGLEKGAKNEGGGGAGKKGLAGSFTNQESYSKGGKPRPPRRQLSRDTGHILL